MLSDATIRDLIKTGAIGFDPLPPDHAIQPASVDLHLGPSFIAFDNGDIEFTCATLRLFPGECVLGATVETITLPDNVIGRVDGKSSWGRQFLMVHSTAGFIDPGFTGQVTLELKNLSPHPLVVPEGAAIAQISFENLDRPALRPYGHPELRSRYQGQVGATPSRRYAGE